MPGFFPMPRGDRRYLIGLLAAAAIVLLPVWQSYAVAGMALSGWLLAVLMIVAPVAALLRLVLERPDGPAGRRSR